LDAMTMFIPDDFIVDIHALTLSFGVAVPYGSRVLSISRTIARMPRSFKYSGVME